MTKRRLMGTGWPHARIVFALLLAVVAVAASMLRLFDPVDRTLLDVWSKYRAAQRHLEQRTDVVIVGIDDAFLKEVDEPLALLHPYLAKFLDLVAASKPVAVGINLVLPSKRFDGMRSNRHPDSNYHQLLLGSLKAALSATPVVLAQRWDPSRSSQQEIHGDFRALTLIPTAHPLVLASSLVCVDRDDRVRRFPGAGCQPDSVVPFSVAMAAAGGREVAATGLINYGDSGSFRYVPLGELLRRPVAEVQPIVQGKFVLLGTVFDDHDLLHVPSPIAAWLPGRTLVPATLVHASLLGNILGNSMLRPVPLWVSGGLAVLAALFMLGERLRRKLAFWLLGSAVLVFASLVLLESRWWLPPAAPVVTGLVTILLSGAADAVRHRQDKLRLRATFRGLVSPPVLAELERGGQDVLQGKRMQGCVLFSDIRNFSAMSETQSPEQTVALLNRYFERMAGIVHAHGGSVSKFIGDGMMALFGAPRAVDEPERRALAAARDMIGTLNQLNRELRDAGIGIAIQIGVGVHRGEMVVGCVGARSRHDYTAIGDTINVAARLEGLCKELGYPVILSEAVVNAAGADETSMLADLGTCDIRGHSPVRAYGWRPDLDQQKDKHANA